MSATSAAASPPPAGRPPAPKGPLRPPTPSTPASRATAAARPPPPKLPSASGAPATKATTGGVAGPQPWPAPPTRHAAPTPSSRPPATHEQVRNRSPPPRDTNAQIPDERVAPPPAESAAAPPPGRERGQSHQQQQPAPATAAAPTELHEDVPKHQEPQPQPTQAPTRDPEPQPVPQPEPQQQQQLEQPAASVPIDQNANDERSQLAPETRADPQEASVALETENSAAPCGADATTRNEGSPINDENDGTPRRAGDGGSDVPASAPPSPQQQQQHQPTSEPGASRNDDGKGPPAVDAEVPSDDDRRVERTAAADAAGPDSAAAAAGPSAGNDASSAPPPQAAEEEPAAGVVLCHVAESPTGSAAVVLRPAPDARLQRRVRRMLAHYAPERSAASVTAALLEYAGREETLLDALHVVFGPEPLLPPSDDVHDADHANDIAAMSSSPPIELRRGAAAGLLHAPTGDRLPAADVALRIQEAAVREAPSPVLLRAAVHVDPDFEGDPAAAFYAARRTAARRSSAAAAGACGDADTVRGHGYLGRSSDDPLSASPVLRLSEVDPYDGRHGSDERQHDDRHYPRGAGQQQRPGHRRYAFVAEVSPRRAQTSDSDASAPLLIASRADCTATGDNGAVMETDGTSRAAVRALQRAVQLSAPAWSDALESSSHSHSPVSPRSVRC